MSKGRNSINKHAFHPGAKGVEQILGHRQGSIMEFLWKHGPQSPADLHAALEATYGIAYTTVYTELTRLVKKGMVRRASRSDARYAAALTREEFMQMTVTHVLEGLIQSHGSAAIHGFVDLVADDSAAYDELRKALKNRKKR